MIISFRADITLLIVIFSKRHNLQQKFLIATCSLFNKFIMNDFFAFSDKHHVILRAT
ncbi:hypothetical protein Xmir_00769 [Xenorhabdus miraniensis]|uniref:Uncharacterized protein n=1 Tax=Xenorhabdus miraniensis TaxID=351674 RepID=A0A2D0JUA2_9GAMM|nr:hypothetical protein Xmir_00769 [Xenorhabdus miraniensis]